MLGIGYCGLCSTEQWKKEKSERLTGLSDKIKFIDLRFEGGQVGGFGRGNRVE